MANNEELIVKFKALDEGLSGMLTKFRKELEDVGTKSEESGNKTKKKNEEVKKSFSDLFSELARGGTTMEGFVQNFAKFAGAAAGVAGAVIGIAMGVKSLVTEAQNGANALNELNQRAQDLGVTIEQLLSYDLAAIASGGDGKSLTQAITFLSERIGSAARGDEGAKKAFDEIGVSIYNNIGQVRGLSEVLRDVAEKFKGGALGAKELSLANDLFGRSAKRVMDDLRSLSENLDTAEKRAGSLATKFRDNLAGAIEYHRKQQQLLDKSWETSASAFGLYTERIATNWKRMRNTIFGVSDIEAITAKVASAVPKDPLKFTEWSDKTLSDAQLGELQRQNDLIDLLKIKSAISAVDFKPIEQAYINLTDAIESDKDVISKFLDLTNSLKSQGFIIDQDKITSFIQTYNLSKVGATPQSITPQLGPEFTVTPNFDINGKDMKEANREWERYSEQVLKAMEAESEFNREHGIWLKKYKESENAFAGFNAGLQQFQDNIGRAGDQMRTFALNLSYGMANAFSSFFFDVMDRKIKNLKDAFVSLGRTIANVIQQAAAAAAGTALASLFLSGAGFAAGNSAGSAPINQGPGYPQFPSMGPPASGVQTTAAPVIIQLNAIDAQSGATFLMKNAGAIAAAIGKYNKKTPGGDVAMMG